VKSKKQKVKRGFYSHTATLAHLQTGKLANLQQGEGCMTKKIGLMVGMEWSWPPAFIEEVNGRHQDVIAEFVTVGGTQMNQPNEYAVIVDRISHEVPYYRTYLKNAMLQGTHVVNNPFMWTADDKFFGASLITKLGLASPKTAALPNKEYVPGIDHGKSLRNLAFPMPWQDLVEYVGGFPCVLKTPTAAAGKKCTSAAAWKSCTAATTSLAC
jgi:hypothetical protein